MTSRWGAARKARSTRGLGDQCVCGHRRADHDHYRSGTDCGTCGPTVCGKFRRPFTADRVLGAILGYR